MAVPNSDEEFARQEKLLHGMIKGLKRELDDLAGARGPEYAEAIRNEILNPPIPYPRFLQVLLEKSEDAARMYAILRRLRAVARAANKVDAEALAHSLSLLQPGDL